MKKTLLTKSFFARYRLFLIPFFCILTLFIVDALGLYLFRTSPIVYVFEKRNERLYKNAVEKQIAIQTIEENDRKEHSPTDDEINNMSAKRDLCYHNADCRESHEAVYDCNAGSENSYYCKRASSETACVYFNIGCGRDYYNVCEANRCVTKQFSAHDPNYFFAKSDEITGFEFFYRSLKFKLVGYY